VRGWALPVFLALAYVAGGAAPLRAGTTTFEDGVIRQLENLSDSLRDLAHREPTRVICECK